MQSLIKNIIFLLLFIAIATIGYYLYVSRESATIDVDFDGVGLQEDLESQEFIVRLRELQNIRLSNEIVRNVTLDSFRDFSVPPTPVPTGRMNPFAEGE